MSTADLPAPKSSEADDIREHRQMQNNDYYKTSVRQLSKSTYFFPTSNLYEFQCVQKPIFIEILSNSTTISPAIQKNETICNFGEFLLTGQVDPSRSVTNYTEESTKLKGIEVNYIDRLEKKRRYLVEESARFGTNDFNLVKCQNPESSTQKVSVNLPLVNWTFSSEPYRSLYIEGCSKRCVLTAPRSQICGNKETIVEFNVSLTFWAYFAIRVFIGIISGTAFAMYEGAVIAILREHKADYGLQRIYGSIGGMISSPLSGMLIDYASQGKGYTDFR